MATKSPSNRLNAKTALTKPTLKVVGVIPATMVESLAKRREKGVSRWILPSPKGLQHRRRGHILIDSPCLQGTGCELLTLPLLLLHLLHLIELDNALYLVARDEDANVPRPLRLRATMGPTPLRLPGQ